MSDRPLDGVALRGRQEAQARRTRNADLTMIVVGVFGLALVAHGVARWLGWL